MMKLYKLGIVACALLLTACQTEQTKQAEPVAETAAETGMETRTESVDYQVQDIAGTWRINGQKTEEVNEQSLQEEFGTGIHLENEMVLSENADFSYYIAINQGGEGIWKLEGNVITADFTTYEPDVREEQLMMTPETGEDGELFIKMTYTEGYILLWRRLEETEPNE